MSKASLRASLLPAMALGLRSTSPETYVDLVGLPSQTILSAQVCAGLFNRDTDNFAGVYTLMDDYDSQWLYDITGVTDPELTDVQDFITSCLGKTAAYIVYDYSTQQALIPSLITLSSVLNAPLIEKTDTVPPTNAVLVYNATEQWADYSPLQAAQYIYANYVNSTTTLAWLNPGYDNAANPSDPPLTQDPHLGITDFVVKEKIFTLYLNDACIRDTDESDFMFELTTSNPWPRYVCMYM